MRLLIIDGNADDRALLHRSLPVAHETQDVQNLAEAFALLAGREWQPEVILLDLHLPDGDGLMGETWSAVRALSAHAPVIVVSAQSLADDPHLGRQARAAGAAGFTSKELIVFSPENLARQLDWAACPAARSLAAGQQDLDLAPELATYDPNSLPALIARLITQQDALHAENQTVAIQRREQLDRIEVQVQRTNGRVNKHDDQLQVLETANTDREKAIKTARWVGGLCLTAVLFLFGDTLKERVFIDKAEVRKIANEQIDAKVAIAKVQAAGTP